MLLFVFRVVKTVIIVFPLIVILVPIRLQLAMIILPLKHPWTHLIHSLFQVILGFPIPLWMAAILILLTTWPPSPGIYLSSDLFNFLEDCYFLSPPLRTSTLLLSLLMTRLCAGGVISSSFLSAIQPAYLFRNRWSCLMLMQVIQLLRAMLSKQPCFFQLSFFKKLF